MPPSVAIGGWVSALLGLAAVILARRASTVRAELIARACHELRGPITAARLGLELGARRGALSADRLRALDLELRQAALAVDDLSAGRRHPRMPGAWEEVDLAGLVADSVEAWRSTAEVRGANVQLNRAGGAVLVLGDPVRLGQAVGNLLSNAIEHGGGGVEVRVLLTEPCPSRGPCPTSGPCLTSGPRPTNGPCPTSAPCLTGDEGPDAVRASACAGTVRIEFVDEGPGLPASVAELARRRRRRGPHGHGLAVASDVAAAHGGHLGAAPSERGARIVLELPVIAPAVSATVRA